MTIKTTRPHNHEVAKEILHKERAKEGVNHTDEKAEKSIEDDYKKELMNFSFPHMKISKICMKSLHIYMEKSLEIW